MNETEAIKKTLEKDLEENKEPKRKFLGLHEHEKNKSIPVINKNEGSKWVQKV